MEKRGGHIASGAILVHLYDYFGVEIPEVVAKRANQYLALGVANGSVTACLDYTIYWPKLKYQTLDAPEKFLFRLRTEFSGGIGFEVARFAVCMTPISSRVGFPAALANPYCKKSTDWNVETI